MITHPHTLPNGPCPGARTFGITVRNCVRCGALLDNGDTRMNLKSTETPQDRVRGFYSPAFGITVYRAGFWSRDGLFYSTGPERDTYERALKDVRA